MHPLLNIIVLPFLLHASAHPQEAVPGGAFAIGALDDWHSSGNYRIYSCGSEAPIVQNILQQSYFSLKTAALSTDGSAYKAFFRSADPGSVTSILGDIAEGPNITTTQHGSRRPTLICVNPTDRHIRVFLKICADSEGTVVIQPPGTPNLFLCPIFFSRKLFPASTDCGVVNHANTNLIARTYIAGSQYGFLVQALADMYIRRGNAGTPGGDVREENSCLRLAPARAVVNPSSYAFYVSSE